MSLASALGLSSGRKVRYAFVARGDTAEEAMLPGVAQTGHSEVAAFVTGDPQTARGVGEQYRVARSDTDEPDGELPASGKIDAIALATPNRRHAELASPAQQAGIRVLVEKPLETTTARCREILNAANASSPKRMVAYRLHCEPATRATIDLIRSGQLGDLPTFSSTFTQVVLPGNHRAKRGVADGPVFDRGPHPGNAARYVFTANPGKDELPKN